MFGSKRRAARDFVAWARDNAIFFDSCDPAAAPGDALSPLDGLLANRRLAYLGECYHFVREKYFYRLLSCAGSTAAGSASWGRSSPGAMARASTAT